MSDEKMNEVVEYIKKRLGHQAGDAMLLMTVKGPENIPEGIDPELKANFYADGDYAMIGGAIIGLLVSFPDLGQWVAETILATIQHMPDGTITQ